jgi:single-strand DNA-binding protein
MASFNQVTLMGNLTRDPEVRYTPKGSAVCDISLAINRKYKSDSGEMKEEVTFVDCTAWAKTAELIGQYCKKGKPLFVTGRLQTESWEDKQTGQKRSRLKVIIENMQFLGGPDGERAERQGAPAQTQSRPAPRQQAPSQELPNEGPMEEDDIPF